jgi:hypothetical protein
VAHALVTAGYKLIPQLWQRARHLELQGARGPAVVHSKLDGYGLARLQLKKLPTPLLRGRGSRRSLQLRELSLRLSDVVAGEGAEGRWEWDLVRLLPLLAAVAAADRQPDALSVKLMKPLAPLVYYSGLRFVGATRARPSQRLTQLR